MPRLIKLPRTDIAVSRLAFGTASLHHLRDRDARVHLLETAIDAGFTHFDTAPLYGFGSAERALGRVWNDHPNITVATKIGLYPPGGLQQSETSMLARKVGGKVFPRLSRAVADWSVDVARRSLDASLVALRSDHVTMLLLHEPSAQLISTDEWLRWIEDEVRSRVRAIGVAGTKAKITPFLAAGNALTEIVQMADSLDGKEADVLTDFGRDLQITYGYLSAAARNGPFDPAQVLSEALARNSRGTVLVSTRKMERLAQFRAILDAETAKPASV